MKSIKFIVILALLVLTSCSVYNKEERRELKAIENNPDDVIFLDYYNLDYKVTSIPTSMIPKYETSNIFLFDKFEGFIESDEDAKIFLIYINDNEMYLLKKCTYYRFELKGSDLEQRGQRVYIKTLYHKNLLKLNINK